jgi:hypothetical protein
VPQGLGSSSLASLAGGRYEWANAVAFASFLGCGSALALTMIRHTVMPRPPRLLRAGVGSNRALLLRGERCGPWRDAAVLSRRLSPSWPRAGGDGPCQGHPIPTAWKEERHMRARPGLVSASLDDLDARQCCCIARAAARQGATVLTRGPGGGKAAAGRRRRDGTSIRRGATPCRVCHLGAAAAAPVPPQCASTWPPRRAAGPVHRRLGSPPAACEWGVAAGYARGQVRAPHDAIAVCGAPFLSVQHHVRLCSNGVLGYRQALGSGDVGWERCSRRGSFHACHGS